MSSKGKVRNHTVLYQHGLLRNSVRLVRYTWDDIQVVAGGSHVPYAAIHNEGGTITKSTSVRAYDRRAHMRKTKRGKRVAVRASQVGASSRHMNTVIPRRQFMGDSYVLRMELRRITLKAIIEPMLK